MAKVHRRIGTPIATELAITGSGLELDRHTIAPARLPDVYAGAPVVVLGRYRGRAADGAAIALTGTSSGDPLKLSVTKTGDGTPALAPCWARAHIRELEDRYATGAQEVEAEIVAVSKHFGVLSRFTAYLAIDRSEIANKSGKTHQIVQPVEQPAGWEMARSAPRAAKAMQAYAQPIRPMPAQFVPPPPAAPLGAPPPIRMQSKLVGGGMPPRPAESAPAPRMRPMAPPPKLDLEGSLGDASVPPPGDIGEAPMHESAPEPAPDATAAYRTKLADLVRELEAQARGALDVPTVRRLRQRLAEWVEDLRSVGADDRLAAAVEHELKRLSAALALGTDLANEVLAVSAELAKLAAGSAPPPAKKRAFWK